MYLASHTLFIVPPDSLLDGPQLGLELPVPLPRPLLQLPQLAGQVALLLLDLPVPLRVRQLRRPRPLLFFFYLFIFLEMVETLHNTRYVWKSNTLLSRTIYSREVLFYSGI